VLSDSRELHKVALNRALEKIDPKYMITEEEHLSRYDGNTTTTKLNMLTKEKGLPIEHHKRVWELKQEMTFQYILDEFEVDVRLQKILKELKDRGYILYCCSNSIWKSIALILEKKVSFKLAGINNLGNSEIL
jgi:beta-phosphoglucomutase